MIEFYNFKEEHDRTGIIFGIRFFAYGKNKKTVRYIGKGFYLVLILFDREYTLHIMRQRPEPREKR